MPEANTCPTSHDAFEDGCEFASLNMVSQGRFELPTFPLGGSI